MNEAHAIRIELAKIKEESDTLAKEFAVVNSHVTIRKIELAAEGLSNKPKTTTDEKLLQLLARSRELNDELAALNKRRKELNKKIPPRQPKPRGERPKNRVYMGTEFRDCNGYERRLALLMAFEIGQERYEELKRQASDDTANHETLFYTGPRPRWDEACRRSTLQEDLENEFDRMMRSNKNDFAGRDI